MRKTYLLLRQLEVLIICGLAKKHPNRNLPLRKSICEELRSAGKRVLKEMMLFFHDYTPPLTQAQKKRGFITKLSHAWCGVFNSLREHHQIPQGSTLEFETLEEWVLWAKRLNLA